MLASASFPIYIQAMWNAVTRVSGSGTPRVAWVVPARRSTTPSPR